MGMPDAPLKLVSFRKACIVQDSDQDTLESSSGSYGFMAPEIMLMRPYGMAVDIFSLGASLHTMLTGVPPEWRHVKAAYHFPEMERWATLSNDAQDFWQRLVDKDPKARPTTVEALQHPWLKGRMAHR